MSASLRIITPALTSAVHMARRLNTAHRSRGGLRGELSGVGNRPAPPGCERLERYWSGGPHWVGVGIQTILQKLMRTGQNPLTHPW